jgi:hypothetical protein
MAWQAIASFLGKEGLKKIAEEGGKKAAAKVGKEFVKDKAIKYAKKEALRRGGAALKNVARKDGRGTDRKTLQRGYVNPTIGADGSFY